jgi:hypothetical protein
MEKDISAYKAEARRVQTMVRTQTCDRIQKDVTATGVMLDTLVNSSVFRARVFTEQNGFTNQQSVTELLTMSNKE